MKKNLFIIFFGIICVLAGIFLIPTEPSSPAPPLNINDHKEYMTEPKMSTFTEEGKLKHNVAAKHWEYKPDANLSMLTAPETVLFNPKSTTPTPSSLHPTEAPLTIQSDSAEFDDKKGVATYHNHVVLKQGTRHLTADTLIIQRNASGDIAQITAIGNPAHFQIQPPAPKPMSTGHANTIHYFPEEEKIIFIDDAELTQKGNIIRGNYLTYSFKSEILSSEAGPGRRTLVIIPKIQKGKHP